MLALLRLRSVNRRSGVMGDSACSSVKTNADEQYDAGDERGDGERIAPTVGGGADESVDQ